MKRLLLGALAALAVLLCVPSARAQNLPLPSDSLGYCFRLGAPGDQAISASCTITVYNAGTLTPATIYSDAAGTPKANPFAAAANGTWRFFIAGGANYDVRLSGGTPAMTPYTVYSVPSTAGVSSFSAGNLVPLFTTNVATATSTPALTFSLTNAGANTVFGRCTGTTGAPSYCSLVPAMFPSPFIPANDNLTDLGASGTQWRTGYFGTSVISPFYTSKAANPADSGVYRLGNNEAVCGELAVPGTDSCITFTSGDIWDFTTRLTAPDGAVATPAYSFTTSPTSGMFWSGTQLCFGRIGVSEFCGNGGPGLTSSGTICTTTTTRCLSAGTASTSLAPFIQTTGGAIMFSVPLVAGNPTTTGWGNGERGGLYFNTTSGVARYWNGSVLRDFGSNVFDCGTTTTCANTATTAARTIIGSVALSSGTPSTAVVASISPAFTSTATYRCTLTNQTTATNNLLKVVNTSSSSFTITGPDTITDTIGFICAGY